MSVKFQVCEEECVELCMGDPMFHMLKSVVLSFDMACTALMSFQ